jgi:hypothetical protein
LHARAMLFDRPDSPAVTGALLVAPALLIF